MTVQPQSVSSTVTVTAAGMWTQGVSFPVGCQVIIEDLDDDMNATVTLQGKYDGADWDDVETFTGSGDWDFEGDRVLWRAGVKSGDYVAGTIRITVRRPFKMPFTKLRARSTDSSSEIDVRGDPDHDGALPVRLYSWDTDSLDWIRWDGRVATISPESLHVTIDLPMTDGDRLPTEFIQNVVDDTNNSSTTNLAAANSYTFTGTATSTLGVNGLQWSLKTDQNATVYIEESPNGDDWDISYSFDYIASLGGRGETIQATQSYWRVRVVLVGTTDTTYFRLQAVLCPVAVPLPSELSSDGRLKSEGTICGQQNPERHVWVSPDSALTVNTVVRLVGTNFNGSTKDTNFWVETAANGGTATQSGGITLATGTNAAGGITYQTKRRARFVIGSPLKFLGFFDMDSDPIADNTRRCGAYDVNNGYFFQLIGTAFSIGTRTNASGSPVDTAVANGSFNGKLGSTWNPVVESHYKFEIEYGEFGAYWYVNDVLLHKSPSPHLSNVLTLPATMENINTGSTTDSIFHCDGMAILRQGLLTTNSQSYYFAPGTTAGVNLKIGAGSVHRVIFGGAANNTIVTLADSTTAATPILWRYLASGALSVPISVDMGGMPFNTGLRLVVATGNAECTVVYE